MATDWGLKVTKDGVNTTTTDPREMLMSSKYQMFKYHADLSTTTTFTPGDLTKTVSVTHGLGYVPAFIPYSYNPNSDLLEIIPNYPYGIGYDTAVESWADTDKVYFKVTMGLTSGQGWNELLIAMDEYYTNYAPYDGAPDFWLGNSAVYGTMESAIRFPSVAIDGGDAVTSAEVKVHVYTKDGTGRLKWDTKGIDVDNVGAFYVTNPFSLATTSANTYKDISVSSEVSEGGYVGVDVKNSFDEIRQRGGWSNGNAMGFTMKNNGTVDENYFADYNYYDSYLRILLTGNLTYNFRTIVFKDKIHT